MKKCRILPVCILICILLLVFSICGKNKKTIMETFNVNAITKEDVTDELVVALFIKEITNEIISFYSKYYSGEIEVYNYEVTIVDIGKKEPGFISIRFGVTPQIGAHNPLGYDELTYLVDSRGNKKLANFEHLKNYEVPERFQEYIIRPLE